METLFRAALVYLFLTLLFRLAGKRTLSQVTPFDWCCCSSSARRCSRP